MEVLIKNYFGQMVPVVLWKEGETKEHWVIHNKKGWSDRIFAIVPDDFYPEDSSAFLLETMTGERVTPWEVTAKW